MEIIKKYQILFLIVLILLTAVCGSLIVRKINATRSQVLQRGNSIAESSQAPIIPDGSIAEVTTPIDNASSVAETLLQEQKVKLIINTGEAKHEFSASLEKDATVFSLLKKLNTENNFSLKYQESSMGVFIEEIYNVKNDAAQNKYWLYKVNGESANVGASSYQLKEGDVVEWNFEEAKGF
jgi:hypothetical protein